jgi:integrase
MVLPSGVRTWYLRYREPDGKQQTQKIGRDGIINKTIARKQAVQILAEVAKGNAPATARKQRLNAPKMIELQARMEKEHYATLRQKTASNYEQIWRLHVAPTLGSSRVRDVTREQVIQMLSKLAPVQRNRVLQCLKAAFTMAEVWGLRPEGTNPCRKISKTPERIRTRYLADPERARLLASLDAMGTTPLRWRFAQLVRLLMLTGCRVGEICRGRWEWLDDDFRLMVIPAERHKTGERTGEQRVVHVPPAAARILKELRQQSHSPWIIAGDGEKHLVGYQKLWLELLRTAKIDNLKVHDLRHNFASVALTKAGLTLPQVGSLLGHASPSTTKRYAHLIDEGAQRMVADVAGKIGL